MPETKEMSEPKRGRGAPKSNGNATKHGHYSRKLKLKDAAFTDAADPGGAKGAAANPDEPLDDPALAQKLAAEDEAAYSQRVYGEYVKAKQALGENVSNIPKDRFWQRLTGRADALVQKHGCRMVRFQVNTMNEQVVLRPVVIR